MVCPLCRYVMDPFDTECRRCHGKGLAKPAGDAPAASGTVPPEIGVALAGAPPPIPSPAVEAVDAVASPEVRAEVPPYFLACYEALFPGGIKGVPRLFRVYGDSDALLFVFAGPYSPAMNDEIKQMRGATGSSGGRSGEIIGRTAAIGARAAGAGGAGVGAAAAGIVLGINWLTCKSMGGEIAKRAQVLDAMTLDELRRTAATEKQSFRVAPDNTSKVCLRPRSDGFFSVDEAGVAGFLYFTHQATGKWGLKLISTADARDAVREFRRVFGPDALEVRFPY